MGSGAPISPAAMAEIPKWLKSSRPRSFLSGAHFLKILILATSCIILGWSVSRVYTGEISTRSHVKHVEPTYEVLQAGGLRRPSLEGGYDGGRRPIINHIGDDHPGKGHDDEEGPPNSIYHKITDKLSTFNPWKPGDKVNGVHLAGSSSSASVHKGSKSRPSNNRHPSYDAVSETVTKPPMSPYASSPSRIGKLTILTGGRNTIYERALRTHAIHNEQHAYPMHTLRQPILADVWSKPAYILSVMMRELAKPLSQRLEWLFWVDADTIILNPYVPVEIFLPPAPDFDNIHMLATYDWNGLNNGIFPIRVCEWSVKLLAAILAFPHYKPDAELTFRDQSAMAALLEEPEFAQHVMKAPQRWFNAYQGELNETLGPFQVRRGDFLVHFAGVIERDERMGLWLDRAEMHVPEWEVELKYTSYPTEVKEFWDEKRKEKKVHEHKVKKVIKEAEDKIEETRNLIKEFQGRLNDDERKHVDEGISKMENLLRDGEKGKNIRLIKQEIKDLEEASSPLARLSSATTKLLLKQAHDLAFEAEKAIMDASNNPTMHDEVERVDEALSALKDLFMDKHAKADTLDNAVGKLRGRFNTFKHKIEELEDMKHALTPEVATEGISSLEEAEFTSEKGNEEATEDGDADKEDDKGDAENEKKDGDQKDDDPEKSDTREGDEGRDGDEDGDEDKYSVEGADGAI